MSDFPSDWKIEALEHVVKKSRPISYGVVQTGDPNEGGVPCVRVVDLTGGNLSLENLITTTHEISQSYKRTILEVDDLMIALRGEIGFVAKVPSQLVGANLTRGVALIAPNHEIAESDYLLQALKSSYVHEEIMSQVNGSALKEIPIGGLKKVKIPLPPLPEQRKIAVILSTWDEAIALTQQLIAALQQRKQALMQLMLLHKHELPIDWRWARLSEFLIQEKRWITIVDDKLYQRCTVKWYNEGVFSRDTLYGMNIRTKRQQLTKEGDFIVAEIDAKEGGFGIIKADTSDSIVSGHYFLFNIKDTIYRDFLEQCIRAGIFQAQVDAIGSTNYSSVRPEQIMRYKLPLPPIQRQQDIADFLTTCDSEITIYSEYLAALKTQKRGLMQQLLTGAVRVSVED